MVSHGSQNEPIFKDRGDYKMYLELVSKYKAQHKFKLFCYSLLPDRLELLIETGDDLPAGEAGASISEIMHDLNSLYTKYFNGRYQKRGHLFESRFKSILVEKVNHLLSMTRHIHLKDIQNPYSSFHIYIASPTPDVIASVAKQSSLDLSGEVKEVLSFLPARGGSASGGKTKDDPKAYERYVLEGDKNEIEDLEKSLRRDQVLGSDIFHQQVKQKVQEHTDLLKEEATHKRIKPVFLYMIGSLVILATASSVYLYVSKAGVENKYQTLLQQKETEFVNKAKFENRSPLSLTELDGTVWEIETVPAPRGGVIRKDHIRFKNGRFESETLAAKSFRSSNYFLVPQGGRVMLWQSAQSNPSGDTVTWRGTWQGDAMKGTLTMKNPGGEQSYSFFSVKWSFAAEQARQELSGGRR